MFRQPLRTRRTNRLARCLAPAIEHLEERLAMTVPFTEVDDSWTFSEDLDSSGSLSIGDVVTNARVTTQYGIRAFGRVTSGAFTGSLPNFDEINDAVAATDVGGTVYLHPGSYIESVTIAKSLTLQGDTFNAADIVLDPSLAGIMIEGAATHATIRNLTVTSALVGIWSTGAAKVVVENAKLHHNGHGINLTDISGDVFLNGVESNYSTAGAVINRAGSVTVVNSSFSSNLGATLGISGLSISRVAGSVQLFDTTANENAAGGIYLLDIQGDVTLQRVTALNNDTDRDGTGDGLHAAADEAVRPNAIGGNLHIQGSRFSRTDGANDGQQRGIYIKRIAGSSLFEMSADPGSRSMEVNGNSQQGVLIEDGGTNATFSGGTYSNNRGNGISVANLSGAVSVGNVTASGNGDHGLRVNTAASVFIGSGTFNNNDIVGIGLNSISGHVNVVEVTARNQRLGGGLEISGAATVAITGGAYSDNDDDGIWLASISAGAQISGITAKNNSRAGLYVHSSSFVSIQGSSFDANNEGNIEFNNVNFVGWGAGNVSPPGNDLTLATSASLGLSLNVAINGTTADTQYDQLGITGPINLNNTPLILSGTHVATAGQSFTILNATSISGQFRGLQDGAILNFNGQPLQLRYSPTEVTLNALSPGFYGAADSFKVVAGTPATFNLLANDIIDSNTGTVLATSFVSPNGPTLTTNADGTVNFKSSTPGQYTFDYGLNFKQHKLLAKDAGNGDALGGSVALDGDTMIVGAALDDGTRGIDQGAVYVYVRSGLGWVQQAKLFAADGAVGDQFGASVAISGDTVVIGAPSDDLTGGKDHGSAYVFVRTGTTWKQQAKLTMTDAKPVDNFGTSVAIDGNNIVVGAPLRDLNPGDNAGCVAFYERNGVIWSSRGSLGSLAPAANNRYGIDVAIRGWTVVAGVDGANSGQGRVEVFNLGQGGTVFDYPMLIASDGATGDAFGRSVAISGDTIVVGAELDDGLAGTDQGSAYVFQLTGNSFTQQAKLVSFDPAASDFFGSSVAIHGDRIAIGARGDDANSRVDQGSALVFKRTGNTWDAEWSLYGATGAAKDNSGPVAISGAMVVMGAPGAGVANGAKRGAVYAQDIRRTLARVSVEVVQHQLQASQPTTAAGIPVTFYSYFAPGVAGTVTYKEGTKVLGTAQVVNGIAWFTTIFETYGNHTVSATFGANGTPVTATVGVNPIAYVADPHVGGMQAIIGGTAAADTIKIETGNPGFYKVTIKNAALGTIPAKTTTHQVPVASSRIVVYAGKQNDSITVTSDVTIPVWVYGEAGNDTILGGSGNDMLFGGVGDDTIKGGGGDGRDILFGGAGIDNLTAGLGGSLLISGPTTFEPNGLDSSATMLADFQLLGIQAEWASDNSLATRTANLRGTGTGPRANTAFLVTTGTSRTVLDDTHADKLIGAAASDWYFANRAGTGTKDTITGLVAASDIADEL